MEGIAWKIYFRNRLLHKSGFLFIAGSIATIIIILPNLFHFVVPGLDIYLALMAIPFSLTIQEKASFSNRYLYISLVLAFAYYFLQIQTLYFLAFSAFLCFVAEQVVGKISRLPFVIAIFISPVFNYLLNVFSFPIRLKISALVGSILSLFREEIQVSGNVISLNNKPYEVESACLGLGMLVTGYILSFAVLAYKQQEKSMTISFPYFSIWLLLTSILLAFSNIFRILVLVWFDIPPTSIAHDISGLISLVFYVLIPAWFYSAYFIKSRSFKTAAIDKIKPIPFIKTLLLLPFVTILIFGAEKFENNQSQMSQTTIPFPDLLVSFKKTYPYSDVVQYKNDESVIYYKRCQSFFNSTHTPTICWKGSGLKLIKEQEVTIQKTQIMTGMLANEKDTLYTAWWYQSKDCKTINEIDWRIDMAINAEPFTLVNITSKDALELKNLLKKYFLKPKK